MFNFGSAPIRAVSSRPFNYAVQWTMLAGSFSCPPIPMDIRWLVRIHPRPRPEPRFVVSAAEDCAGYILPMMPATSAAEKERSVWVRTLPSAPMLMPSAIMAWSSGASTIETKS